MKKPVIKGLYADPDLIKYKDTYYLYPTTDGFEGWSGTQFNVFSSKNLDEFKHEAMILDLQKDVKWAIGSAWAPCVAVKEDKFYFYFCGKRKDGVSCIGVAYADNPIGPFTAIEEPLLTPEMLKMQNINIGQVIDPSIYYEDDNIYLLFGNGTPCVVLLNKDMISIKQDTIKPISGAYDFREAITVFKKDDLYHFTWSCDDTGSENYHVNYGISNNLTGPIEYLYPVLSKNVENDILGTGHHCIVMNENGDNIIAYHRFGTPLDMYQGYKGTKREVCIDKIEYKNKRLQICTL